MESINHHFWGDITAWFVTKLVGIDYNPSATNLNHVDIKPHIPDNLNDASAYYDSVMGKIECSWVKENDIVKLTVNVPTEACGVIAPQNNYCFQDGETHKRPGAADLR